MTAPGFSAPAGGALTPVAGEVHQVRHKATVGGLHLDPEGTRVILASDISKLSVWDVDAGKAVGPVLKVDGPLLRQASTMYNRKIRSEAHGADRKELAEDGRDVEKGLQGTCDLAAIEYSM